MRIRIFLQVFLWCLPLIVPYQQMAEAAFYRSLSVGAQGNKLTRRRADARRRAFYLPMNPGPSRTGQDANRRFTAFS